MRTSKFLLLVLSVLFLLALTACNNDTTQPYDPDRNAPKGDEVGVVSPGGYAPAMGDPNYGLVPSEEPKENEVGSGAVKAGVTGAAIGASVAGDSEQQENEADSATQSNTPVINLSTVTAEEYPIAYDFYNDCLGEHEPVLPADIYALYQYGNENQLYFLSYVDGEPGMHTSAFVDNNTLKDLNAAFDEKPGIILAQDGPFILFDATDLWDIFT